MALGFAQGNTADTVGAASSQTISYTLAQTVGNLNVVMVNYDNSGAATAVQSVTDTQGNHYNRVPTTNTDSAGQCNQEIWWAWPIASHAAGNVVTVTLNGACGTGAFGGLECFIHEYNGLSGIVLLDKASGGSGSSGGTGNTILTGTVTLGWSIEIAVAFTTVAHTAASGTGFTLRETNPQFSDVSEDKFITTGGTVQGVASQNTSGSWGILMATFAVVPVLQDPEVSPRGRGRPVVVTEDPAKDVATSTLLNTGWIPVDVDPRGRGRVQLESDLLVRVRQTGITETVGWVPVEVEPRGKGRIPIPEDPILETKLNPALSDIASFVQVDNDVRGKGRASLDISESSSQPIPFSDIASFVSVDVEPRGRGRFPLAEELPQESAPKSVGWISVDVEPRGKGRAPIVEDPILETLIPPKSVGWINVDVETRGKGRAPIPEDPILETRIIAGLDDVAGWIPVDVEPRGKGRAPIPEDPLIKARQTGITETVGWIPVDVEPRGKGRAPIPEDPPLESFLLRPLGWIDVENSPRGKGRAPLAEEPPLEARISGSIGWLPSDVEPRGKGRFPLAEDSPVQTLHGLLPVGWISVDVEPRGKGRAPIPEEFPTDQTHIVVLGSIGWAGEDLLRGRARAPLDLELFVPEAVAPPSPPPPPGGQAVFPTLVGGRGGGGASPGGFLSYSEILGRIRLVEEWEANSAARKGVSEADSSARKGDIEATSGARKGEVIPDSSIEYARKTETQAVTSARNGSDQATSAARKGVLAAIVAAVIGTSAAVAVAKQTSKKPKPQKRAYKRSNPIESNDIPPEATFSPRWINCGKTDCEPCKKGPSHGPYWYAYWRDERGKRKTKYIGRQKP